MKKEKVVEARSRLGQILDSHKPDYLSSTLQNLLPNSCKGFQCSKKLAKRIKLVLVTIVIILGVKYYYEEMQGKKCALSLPPPLRYAFRPPESCDFCANIKNVPRLQNINPQEFEKKFAYNAAPVIISDATKNWTAVSLFNYWYFRDVYGKAKQKQQIKECQFLPYKTGFFDIYDALDMEEDRVELKPGEQPWYFGWSNCHAETAEEFRKHYGRPYFLPESSENNAVDWFFIGTSGLGAQMHIDNVRLPSWQAQLAGSKRWLLVPPPECYLQCHSFDVVVQQGDIIVLDTNKWYHQTFVQPGAISLTIGAEYD
ncbi:bifunctional arginine demethylase and lysyl-hydroxylase psr-1 isoform X2 [Drosophila ficusphila]|uniref:bifunctional arginine demethylase and lysyl-hydroxylase psr-1 isoform X2 n=1 Tax=Drosophila ficusphila TaxID=30025 RepID=UPI0007E65306|nr:bifunctional arginine demethylase and lysyl-hydroxylase psr-1 isoform X2 [Drosophila ficusphila]